MDRRGWAGKRVQPSRLEFSRGGGSLPRATPAFASRSPLWGRLYATRQRPLRVRSRHCCRPGSGLPNAPLGASPPPPPPPPGPGPPPGPPPLLKSIPIFLFPDTPQPGNTHAFPIPRPSRHLPKRHHPFKTLSAPFPSSPVLFLSLSLSHPTLPSSHPFRSHPIPPFSFPSHPFPSLPTYPSHPIPPGPTQPSTTTTPPPHHPNKPLPPILHPSFLLPPIYPFRQPSPIQFPTLRLLFCPAPLSTLCPCRRSRVLVAWAGGRTSSTASPPRYPLCLFSLVL